DVFLAAVRLLQGLEDFDGSIHGVEDDEGSCPGDVSASGLAREGLLTSLRDPRLHSAHALARQSTPRERWFREVSRTQGEQSGLTGDLVIDRPQPTARQRGAHKNGVACTVRL